MGMYLYCKKEDHLGPEDWSSWCLSRRSKLSCLFSMFGLRGGYRLASLLFSGSSLIAKTLMRRRRICNRQSQHHRTYRFRQDNFLPRLWGRSEKKRIRYLANTNQCERALERKLACHKRGLQWRLRTPIFLNIQ